MNLIDLELEFDTGNLSIILVHIFFIVTEIFIVLYKIYRIYQNDLQTNNQPTFVKKNKFK